MSSHTASHAPPNTETLLPEPFLMIADVAKIIRVSPKTLRRWIADKSFPLPVYLGKSNRPRWKLSEIRNFLDGQR
jgi:predicted DNA-binding transcriptional regulator AlpA